MLSEFYILSKMEPYLNSRKELSEFDFDDLFGVLSLHEQYEVIDIMIKNNIGYGLSESDEQSPRETSICETEEKKNESTIDDQYKELMVLTNEQLCIMAQKNEKKAVTAIIMKNRGFVLKRAQQIQHIFAYSSLTIEDLYQEGVCGELVAISRFNTSLGYTFLTYADFYIRQRMRRAIVNTGYSIRIPVHRVDQIRKVTHYRSLYPLMNYEELSAAIAADGNKISPAQIKKCIDLAQIFSWTVSLNDEVGEEEDTELLDFVEDKRFKNMDDFIIAEQQKDFVEELLSFLKPRESRIVKEYYGFTGNDNATLESVAQKFGVTRERIRQILNIAMTKMKNAKSNFSANTIGDR